MEIRLVSIKHLEKIATIFDKCKLAMEIKGIYQWTSNYPTASHIKEDIENEHLHGLFNQQQCIGVVSLNSHQDEQYKEVSWSDLNGNALVIHRLAIDPLHQGMGFGKQLMDFAEASAVKNNYSSIRLDAYSGNERSLNFYLQRDYEKRGEVYFPGRDLPFLCFEKLLR